VLVKIRHSIGYGLLPRGIIVLRQRAVSIAVEFGLDAGLDFWADQKLFAEEFLQFVENGLRVGDEVGEGDFEQLDAVAFFEDFSDLLAVALLGFDEVGFFGFGQFALARKHGPLGINDLCDGSQHVEDFVAVLAGQVGEQGGDHFHGFASGGLNEAGIFGEFFDFLPFVVALGIVLVGKALGIGHERQAAGLEDLHHEAGAGARQTGNDEKIEGLDGVVFGFEAFGLGEFDGILRCADRGAGIGGLAEGGQLIASLDFFVEQDFVALHLTNRGFVDLAEEAIDAGEEALGANEFRREAQAVQERALGLGELLDLDERGPEEEMPERISVLEADGFQGGSDRFGGASAVEMDAGECEEGLGIVRIGYEDLARGGFGIFPLAEGEIALREHELEARFGRVLFPHTLERAQSGKEVFFLDGDGGLDEIGLLGAAEGLGSSGDRGIRLIEEAELELAGG